jgi:type II secretory pathway pseudopilin PulG
LKKSFSIVEVLVAVSLIVTVITAILQMQQNNLHFLEKFKISSLNKSYISLAISSSKQLKDETIYLSDKIDMKDDDIRKELKAIKIKIKDTKLKDITVPENNYLKSIKVIKTTYSLDNMKHNFYVFKL